MTDLAAYRVSGQNNPDKQWSVTRHNAFVGALEDAFDTPPAEITASGLVVVNSRVALAAIVAPSSGDAAYLTEVGREGLFAYSTDDLSDEIAQDTYESLYVESGAGAWVRVVEGNTYQASWAGCSTELTDNGARINAMLPLVPVGARFVGLGRESQLPVVESVIFTRAGLLLEQWNIAVHSSWVSATAAVRLAASGIVCRGNRFYGRRTVDSEHGSTPFTLMVSAVQTIYDTETSIDDVIVEGCHIEGSAAFTAYGHSLTAATMAPVRGLKLIGNTFVGDYALCNLIGVENCNVDGSNLFIMDGGQPSAIYVQPLRIYGSRDIVVGPCRMVAAGTAPAQFAAIKIVEAGFPTGLTLGCGNVTINGVRIENASASIWVESTDGLVSINGVTFGDGTAVDDPLTGVTIDTGGSRTINHVSVRGCYFGGVLSAALVAGDFKSVIFRNNTFIGNAAIASSTPLNASGATGGYFEWIGNSVIVPDRAGYNPMQALVNVASGKIARVHDNIWGESDGSTGGFIKVWGSGAGKIVTANGQTPQNASLGSGLDQGTNDRNPVGTFAAIA